MKFNCIITAVRLDKLSNCLTKKYYLTQGYCYIYRLQKLELVIFGY